MTLALVLADTHVPDGRVERLPASVWTWADAADVILHAGDVTGAALLAALAERAPVHAVLGNNDVSLTRLLPETRLLDLDGLRVAMVHDSGDRVGRAARMHRRFPNADIVVYGHSHVPVDEQGVDGMRLFNPGSPTQRRAQPVATFGLLEVSKGSLVRHEILPV